MTFEKAQATIFLSYSGVFDMKSKLRHFFLLTFSTLVMAAGTYFFKFPNHFTFGGITGLAVLVAKTGVMSAGDFNFITNMILLIIGFLFSAKNLPQRRLLQHSVVSCALRTGADLSDECTTDKSADAGALFCHRASVSWFRDPV